MRLVEVPGVRGGEGEARVRVRGRERDGVCADACACVSRTEKLPTSFGGATCNAAALYALVDLPHPTAPKSASLPPRTHTNR